MNIVILPGMAALLQSPVGPVGRKLEQVADVVLAYTDTSLSMPWGGSRSRNPSPGPPRLRTGDLQKSLMHTNATLVAGELQVTCAAPAVHRDRFYADILVSGEGDNLDGPYKLILDAELELAVQS
jgi:hypothetical protein